MKAIRITFCSCNKYMEKKQWRPYKDINELIGIKVREQVPRAKLSFKHIKIPLVHKESKESQVIAKTKGEEQVVKVILKLAKCDMCAKEGTQYFEGTLQVRSSNLKVLEASIEFLKKRVENLRHRGVFINKTNTLKDGYDLYMTSRKIAQTLGKELHEIHGGIFKSSPHHYSRDRQTSKNIYRVNVLVRLPGFVKGDIILGNEKVLLVKKLGKKIKLLDLEKNSSVIIDYSKLSYHVLKKHSTYVSKVHPGLEVINPFDYQSSWVKNKPKKKLDLGQEVNVIVHKGIYVVE